MVLNIGGIANLSLLIPGQPVGGYDTGPGNMLMDAWIWRQAGKPYSKDAEWARAGKVILPLLQNMLSDPYSRNLHRKAPDANTLTMVGWSAICAIFRVLIPRLCRRHWQSHRRDHF